MFFLSIYRIYNQMLLNLISKNQKERHLSHWIKTIYPYGQSKSNNAHYQLNLYELQLLSTDTQNAQVEVLLLRSPSYTFKFHFLQFTVVKKMRHLVFVGTNSNHWFWFWYQLSSQIKIFLGIKSNKAGIFE